MLFHGAMQCSIFIFSSHDHNLFRVDPECGKGAGPSYSHINQLSIDSGCPCKSVMALGEVAFSSQGHFPERH